MPLISLAELSPEQHEQLAGVLHRAAREHAPEWIPTLAAAREQLAEALAPDVLSRVVVTAEGRVVGYAAVEHQYGRLWELHPLAVDVDRRGRGHGRALVSALEQLVAARGGLTLWVGTSDETNATSLTGIDLYADPLAAIRSLAVPEGHAIRFWQHLGYRIVGLAPDAEGHGRPSIHLAKRVGPWVVVRPEREDDAAALRHLIVDSFGASKFGYGGEAELVERLRAAGPERIELVAEIGSTLVGHILFTPARVGEVEGLALGPMAVANDHQRSGIGSRLISDGLGLARRAGHPFVIVLGHPDYYPRFGFESAVLLGVSCPFAGVPDEAFMIAVLDPSRRAALRGLARYHDAFMGGSAP
jgi:predicted N-acetyltransferase YhbS